MRINEIEKIVFSKFEDVISNFIDHVLRDCKPFLNACPKFKHLYRQINKSNAEIILDRTINRTRTWTSSDNMHVFDNKLKENGFVALRSNSLFVASDNSKLPFDPYQYRNYIVFPKGNFNITWFDAHHVGKDDIGSNRWVQSAMAALTDLPYDEWVKTKNNREMLMDVFWEKYKNFFHHGTETNIGEAIDAGSEIMIAGCNYYAIATNLYNEFNLSHYLN